jgi:uncharacterized protein YdhG (YjbR/CyaY superfamily)
MSSQVEAYIGKQKSPLKEIVQEVRSVFKKTLPNSKEEMRWGVITFADGKFYIAAINNRVHVGFAITGLTDEEISQFEGTGKTMRHIKISSTEGIDKLNLVKLIQMVDRKAVCKPC